MDQEDEMSFIRILISDVARAEEAHRAKPDQAAKRDFVRASFAAIEGAVWVFREHVHGLAQITEKLEEAEKIALSETAYNVDQTGRVLQQNKFLTLVATIRLCASIANRIAPSSNIDFSASGWQDLRDAIQIRNRITHPKTLHDLLLSDRDVTSCANAMQWFLDASTRVMRETVSAAREYVDGVGDVLRDLKAGDQGTWDVYLSLMTGTGDEA